MSYRHKHSPHTSSLLCIQPARRVPTSALRRRHRLGSAFTRRQAGCDGAAVLRHPLPTRRRMRRSEKHSNPGPSNTITFMSPPTQLNHPQAIVWPLTRAAEMRALGTRAITGIVINGPPGCGKTSLARAIAAAAPHVAFFSTSAPEIVTTPSARHPQVKRYIQ